MHQKLFATVFITLFSANLMVADPSLTRSPYELLNCLNAKDRDGLTETLKHISVNTRFTPRGDTILMATIDMYAQRLAQRSTLEFEVGKAVGGVAASIGCLAAWNVPDMTREEKDSASQDDGDPKKPGPAPYQHNPAGQHGHSSWRDPLGSVRMATDSLLHTCGRFNHMMDQWDQGAIRVEPAGRVTEETAQSIQDAAAAGERALDGVSDTTHHIRYYMQTTAIISCAATAAWLSIKVMQQYLRMQKIEERYEKDIEIYESIIDELLAHEELDFNITNNDGENVVSLMRRLIMVNAGDEEIMDQLLKIERKVLHAARGIKV